MPVSALEVMVKATDCCGGLVAVCGNTSYGIQQQFLGNGTCVMNVFVGSTVLLSQVQCNTNVFPGQNCKTLNASLLLFTTNQVGANASTFVPPRFDLSLAGAGLGQLQSILVSLFVIVDHGPAPIPVNIAPSFLTSLTDIFSLIVIESIDYNNFPNLPPLFPRLVGLPGLVNLQRINTADPANLPYGFTSLVVQGTAMRDLLSFSGLTCPPANLNITRNIYLQSLNGLNSLATWTADTFGPKVVVSGNNLTGASSISALRVLAGCPTTNLFGDTFIQVTGCATITVTPT